MQAEKRQVRTSSKGRYMDIIRPAKKTKRPAKKAAIIEATRVTTEVYDPELDDVETMEELELSVKQPKPAPATKKPRPVRKDYPFIASVNVDKRPLSPYVPKNSAASNRPAKNIYSAPAKPLKKVKKSEEKPAKKSTKIVEPSKKSGLSLVIIIIITVILGAAAGIGAYLILPH